MAESPIRKSSFVALTGAHCGPSTASFEGSRSQPQGDIMHRIHQGKPTTT